MAKRPQKRSAELTAPQLEQPQFQVQARPVDTAIKPSTAGAPAAPQLKQDAVKPDLEPAREMQRMGQALGALSGTVRDLAQLEKIRTDEFYKEAVNLATETDLSIAELMEKGDLQGTSPAHIRGYSRAAATGQLLELAKMYDSQEALMRSHEDALDPEYAGRFITSQADKLRQAVKKTGLDYGHFNKAFNSGLGGLLEKVNARHGKWAGEEHQNRAAANLSAELEMAFRGMWDTDDELKKAKFRQHVAELIEGRGDGVLTRRATHQLMGQAAVDLIINMPEAEEAMNAVLDDVPIGPGVPDDFFTPRSGMDQLPIDSRKGRLGKIAEVRNYRTDKRPQMENAVSGRSSSQRRAAHGAAVSSLHNAINVFSVRGALNDGATFSAEQVIQDGGGLVQFVTERATELGIELGEKGYSIRFKDDDSVLLVDNVTGAEKTLPVRASISNARTNLWRELAGEGMNRDAQVHAALSTGSHIPKSVVAENDRRISSGLNAAYATLAAGGGFDAETLDELLEVHQVWEGMQGVGLGLDYVGNMGNHLLMRAISRSRRLVGPRFMTEQDALESLAATLFTRRQEAGGESLSVSAQELERQLGSADVGYENEVPEIKFLTKTLMLMDDSYRNNPGEAIAEARAIYEEQYDSPFGDLSAPIFKPLLYGDNPGQYQQHKAGMRRAIMGRNGMVGAIQNLDPLIFTEDEIARNKTVDIDDMGIDHVHVMPNPRDPGNPTYRFRLRGGGHFHFNVNRINGEGDETTTFLSHNEVLQFLARKPAELEKRRREAEEKERRAENVERAVRGYAIDEFLLRLLPLSGPGWERELEGFEDMEIYGGRPRQSGPVSRNQLGDLVRDFRHPAYTPERLFDKMAPSQRARFFKPEVLLAARQLPQEIKRELPQFAWMWSKSVDPPYLDRWSYFTPFSSGGREKRRQTEFGHEGRNLDQDINPENLFGRDVEGVPYKRSEREQLIYELLTASPRFYETIEKENVLHTTRGPFEYVNPVLRYRRTTVTGAIPKPGRLFDLHVAHYYNVELTQEQRDLLGNSYRFLEREYPFSFYELEDDLNRVVDPANSQRDD